MREIPKLLSNFKVLSVTFAVFIVVYIAQALTATPTRAAMERYHVTAAQLHRLSLTIVIPYIIIWLIGLIGYMWLRKYTTALGESKDGKAFGTIGNGVLLLVLWLPISVLVSGFASHYYTAHPSATASLIRVVNYVNVLLLLPAFYLVYRGSKQLLEVAKVRYHGLTQRQSMLFVAFSAVYVFIALSDSARQVAHGATTTATYYLPDWLTVMSILIPRLLTWYIGLAAVANIFLYREKIKGAIYKEALRSLAIGLGVVVAGIVILRVIQSLSTVLGGWSLGLLVLLIYVLLIILGVGYFLIAKGAKRLLRIEEL